MSQKITLSARISAAHSLAVESLASGSDRQKDTQRRDTDRAPEDAGRYASWAQRTGATGPGQSGVMSLTNHFDISGVIGPLSEGAEVSEDGPDCRRQVTDLDVALAHAVYTSAQMLDKHPQNCHFCHSVGPSARLAGGHVRSATRCSITRSDMTCAGPDRSNPSAYRCTETATPNSAHCSLSHADHQGTQPAGVGVPRPHTILAP
jgi:hypothetical protein